VQRLTEAVAETFAAHGLSGQARILGFDWRVLRAAEAAAPDVPRVALVEPETWLPGSAGLDPGDYGPDGSAAPGCAAAARDIGAAWLSPADAITSPDLVAAAGRAGLKTAVWTVNDPARMGPADRARGGRDRHRPPGPAPAGAGRPGPPAAGAGHLTGAGQYRYRSVPVRVSAGTGQCRYGLGGMELL
jgi:glycerophosphoryl diester phosphodiesterase